MISFIFNNYFILYSKINVCLCIIGKKENLYAKEYINHYKKIGYNHIFLYDIIKKIENGNEEKFEDVLQKEINDGFVSIINYRGYRGSKNHPQFDAYYDCYDKNNKNYKWLSFFDFDEFLELIPKNMTINAFLNNKRFYKCQNIKINWLFYSDNNLIYYQNISIQKRFITPVYKNRANIHIKSTVRGNLKINYLSIVKDPHTSQNIFKFCSSSGNIIKYNSPYVDPPEYKYAFLKHYHTKTIEEFCAKIKRGRATRKVVLSEKEIKYRIMLFFTLNNLTKEKLDVVRHQFNISY